MIIFGARGAARAHFLPAIFIGQSVSASLFRPDIKAHKPILNWRYF
jgi:hypothetical protein